MVELSDEALWSAVLKDDDESFASVFRRHAAAVHTQCARRAGSYDAADDLVATAFMEAWRSRDRARFVNGSIRPWLLVVASHVAAKHVRTTIRRSKLLERVPRETSLSDHDRIAERLDAAALAPRLAAAVSRLNLHEQDVVALCDLGEYGHAEAAAVLGIPVGTVKSRLFRAHHKLRTSLGEIASNALELSKGDANLEEARS